MLMEWPGLTLSWLWEMSDANVIDEDVNKARLIYDYCRAHRPRIKLAESWANGASASLVDVGCIPDDRDLLRSLLLTGGGYSRWFEAWRAAIWRDIFPILITRTEFSLPKRTEGFPVLDPVASALLSRLDLRYTNAAPSAGDLLGGIIPIG